MASAGRLSPRAARRRVLIIVQNLPVPFDRRAWQEATTLASNGYKVSVICPKGRGHDAAYEVIDDVRIYRHPLPLEASGALGYLLEYASSLWHELALTCKIFRRHGFDAIHACNPPDTIFLIGGFFRYCFGKKFLFDHHDLNPELYKAKFHRRGFFYWLLRLCERLTFAAADVTIATNGSYRDIAVTRGRMAPQDVFIVRSGPDLSRLHPIAPDPALKMGKRFLIGYVGVMGDQEGIAYLIEAARILTQEQGRSDVHFTLLGDGPAFEKLKALARERGVADVMTFAGRVDDETLLKVLSTADICVNPDEVNAMNDKSTMNKILEYMALAKPIVQFDVTEGRVSAGNASLYARANDAHDFAAAIATLLDDPDKRAAMGALGRTRVETTLAWSYEAPKLLAAYEWLFAKTSLHEKLAWYRHRLAAMSPPEILHRMREAILRRIDRYRRFRFSAPADSATPLIPALQERMALWDVPQGLLDIWRDDYERAKRGEFHFLGRQWPVSESRHSWHFDPMTGAQWPSGIFCFTIDYRHAGRYGDVKYVWERARLQYLQTIAVLALKTRDDEAAHFCIAEIMDWIESNPPYRGIHWSSGIELALRAVSMLVVTSLLQAQMTQAQSGAIVASLGAHGYWLARYPSRFSSANNHAAAESLGLFLIGALCPALPQAAQWKLQGWEGLCDAANRLILPDGVGAEQSPAYLAFLLEMLLLGRHVARACQLPVPKDYLAHVQRAGEFLRWLCDDGGRMPLIGDDDNSQLLGAGVPHASYVGSILACVANAPRGSGQAPSDLRQALLGLGAYPNMENPPAGLRHFTSGGYTIGRHPTPAGRLLLVFDHGPLGYAPLCAHGHADALSVWLHLGAQPVLVDAGTYLYHASGGLRDYFRGSEAHNTLTIAGKDTSRICGNFNWSRHANARLIASGRQSGFWWAEAEHDGYQAECGVLHRRRVELAPSLGLTIEDRLAGRGINSVNIHFLLHPALSAIADNHEILVMKDEQLLLKMTHEGPLAMELFSPGAEESGWHSASFGSKEPATRIVFHGLLAAGEIARTRFIFPPA